MIKCGVPVPWTNELPPWFWPPRKYFVHLNWIRLATNPSWLDSSIGRAAGPETRRCEFKSRLRQCQINMSLVFHISKLHFLCIFFSGHTVTEATMNTTNARGIMWDLWSLKKEQNE